MYLQDWCRWLRALGYERQAENSIIFHTRWCALAAHLRREGIELSEEDKRRPYVEVIRPQGLGVKADDLIDKLIEKALDEVTSRHAEAPADSRQRAATQIAIAALRYFMLKYTRNSVIAFDSERRWRSRAKPAPTCSTPPLRARRFWGKLATAETCSLIFERH